MSAIISTEKPPPPQRNGRRVAAVSLSPRKTRKALNSSMVVPARRRIAKSTQNASRPNFDVALSKTETVLVTATGDVLVSRCRYSSKPYMIRKERNGVTEDIDDHSTQFWWESSDCQSVCNPCAGSGSPGMTPRRSGLLGGAPPQLEAMVEPESGSSLTDVTESSAEIAEKGEEEGDIKLTKIERAEGGPKLTTADAPELETDASNENQVDDLEVLPSFDYSHFAGEGNDMVPHPPTNELPKVVEDEQPEQRPLQETKQPKPEQKVSPPILMHGVPTFLPSFYQVKITQVSANPLGSHVVLISAEALLFSYGLNNHGQLGHGYKSTEQGGSKGFVATPSIVTPLLENGGKAVVCSAGVDYSLVVVKTEGRRIGRLNQTPSRPAQHRRGSSDSGTLIHMTRVTSLPSRIQSEEDESEVQSSDDSMDSMYHHQLYGFGRNDGRKLGLVDPSKRKKAEDVLVPRRVALHCKVWPGTKGSDDELTPPGIFAVAASAHHSAALVRRASGAVELYTWGDASFHALGPMKGASSSRSKSATDKKGKNRRTNGRFTPLPMAVTVPTVVKDLSYLTPDKCTNGQGIIPVQVALGQTSTFVTTSSGKVLSFGKSEIGLLGQGHGVVVTDKPGQVLFPSTGSRLQTRISSISVGPSHAVAVASNGKVYAWGNNDGAIMGFDSALRKHLSRGARRDSGRERRSSISDELEWIPREVEVPDFPQSEDSKVKPTRTPIGPPPLSGDSEKTRVIEAYAGYNMTVFVKETGAVLSCGTSSGRLGLGETGTTSVITPTPLFGGLYLWNDE